MTDSVDKRDSKRFITPEVKERLALAKIERKENPDFTKLPTHVRVACAMHELMGMTWEEIGKRLGKSPATLSAYTGFAGYKKWREELQAHSEDPKTMAELTLRSNAMGITLEYLAAFQAAVDAGAYSEVGKMAKDLLDRAGVITKKNEGAGAINIRLSLGGALLEGPIAEAEWTEEGAEVEE